MKKVYISSIIFISLFCFTSLVLAQTIPNYGPANWETLFVGIANANKTPVIVA
jgi:hypothetical protein